MLLAIIYRSTRWAGVPSPPTNQPVCERRCCCPCRISRRMAAGDSLLLLLLVVGLPPTVVWTGGTTGPPIFLFFSRLDEAANLEMANIVERLVSGKRNVLVLDTCSGCKDIFFETFLMKQVLYETSHSLLEERKCFRSLLCCWRPQRIWNFLYFALSNITMQFAQTWEHPFVPLLVRLLLLHQSLSKLEEKEFYFCWCHRNDINLDTFKIWYSGVFPHLSKYFFAHPPQKCWIFFQ